MTPELITNSRMAAFRACQRLHQIKYVQGYRAVDDSEDLEFGTVMHKALEGWWLSHQKHEPNCALQYGQNNLGEALDDSLLDETARAKAEVLLIGYDARWGEEMANYDVLGVESKFVLPLAGVRGFRRAGKIDAVVQKRSDLTVWTVEHKTSGADLTPGSTYWTRLRMDSQVSLYFDGGESLKYGPIAGCIYDVIGKPDIRLLKATPEDKRKYVQGTGRLYANQRDKDETVEEFKVRLAEKIVEAPHDYYQRTEVIRLDAELNAAREDVRQTALLIRESTKKGYAPRNPDQCWKFGAGKPCAFVDVCCQVADLEDTTKFRKLENVHPELAE